MTSRIVEAETSWREEVIIPTTRKPWIGFPDSHKEIICNSIIEQTDLLSAVESICTQTITHIGAVTGNVIGMVNFEVFKENFDILDYYYFLPDCSYQKLKLNKRSIGDIYKLHDNGERIAVETECFVESGIETIKSAVDSYYPNFSDDEHGLYLAFSVKGNYATVLGVLHRAVHGRPAPQGLFASNNCLVDFIDESIDNIVEMELTVHHSIIDRISGENLSIPYDYFRRGLLSKPHKINFSESVAKELDIPRNTSFKIWKNRDWLYFSVSIQGYHSMIHRMNISSSIRKQRVSTKSMFLTLRESLAMKRTGPIDNSRVINMAEKELSEYDFKSIYPGLFWHQTINHFPKAWDESDGQMIWSYFDDMAIHRIKVLPLLLHLLLAKLDPSLRGEIRRIASEGIGKRKSRRKGSSKRSKKYDWGSDKIRYISPKKESGNSSSPHPHYVTAHTRLQPISKQTTIEDYRERGVPITKVDGKLAGLIYISSFFKSGGLKLPESRGAVFHFGSLPRNYSLMAIDWMKSVEKRDGITIKHARNGGEQRVSLGEGRWLSFDGYCEENHTVYEFHGDVYHGNPEIFPAEENCHPFDKSITAGELYEKTIQREQLIKNLGFNIESIWESDWKAMRNVEY